MIDSTASTVSSATTIRANNRPRSQPPEPGGAPLHRSRPAGRPRLVTGALAALLVLAVVLRLDPVLFHPSIAWYDEIFQAIEQAHRLVYGTGLVPWEFQLDMRSWLLPGVIAGLMELAGLFGNGPDYYLPVIYVAFGLLAAAPVLCCFLWCRRWFSEVESLAAAAAVAVAPELVFFGARTLTGVIAGHVFVIALYVLAPGYRVTSRRRLFVGGLLLGLTFYLRIQLAPGLAVAALWGRPRTLRQRLPAILAGVALILTLAGSFDWVTLGSPFASIWRNVLFNLLDGASKNWGTAPWYRYLRDFLGMWALAAAPLVVLVMYGARRMAPLLAVALTIIAAHSLIPHKEYRFIYPALLIVMIVAGVGLAQLIRGGRQLLIARGLPSRAAGVMSTLLALGLWVGMSAYVWEGAALAHWRNFRHDHLLAAEFVEHLPTPPCGVGLYASSGRALWARFGGYTYFQRAAPIYWPVGRSALAATAPGFNVLIYAKQPPPPALGYTGLRCFGRICVMRRAGGCAAIPMAPLRIPPKLQRFAAKAGLAEAAASAAHAAGRNR